MSTKMKEATHMRKLPNGTMYYKLDHEGRLWFYCGGHHHAWLLSGHKTLEALQQVYPDVPVVQVSWPDED